MTTFLLLLGATVLGTGGVMYFTHAARHDSRWVTGSLLFPFVVPIYYRRHWEDLRVAALLQASGLVMVLAGSLIHVFGSVKPEGVNNVGEPGFTSAGIRHTGGFVDSERALKLLVGDGRTSALAGRVRGASFHPDRVELIDGVLRMSQGGGFFPEREIAIHLGDVDFTVRERVKFTLVPVSTNVPRIFLSWLGADGKPETEIINGGYRLDLQLAPLRENQVTGYLQLILPDGSESYASGEFFAYTDHLRYRGEEVERGFDHEDTLEFVAREFLESQHPDGNIDHIGFADIVMDTLERRGTADATVHLGDGRQARYALRFGKGEFGWGVMVPETRAATQAAGYESVYRVMPDEQRAPRRASAPTTRTAATPAEHTVAFAELASLAGRSAVVEYRSGRREEGVLHGLRKDRLVMTAAKGGGMVEYQLAESEIAAVRLAGGQVLRVAGGSGAAPVKASPTAVAPAGEALTAPVVAGVDLAPLVNRNVRVVAGDGKTTVGMLRGVNSRNRLVVEVSLGAGRVDYTVPVDQVVSIAAAGR